MKKNIFPKDLKILITGMGGMAGICTAYTLKEFENIELYGTDIKKNVGGFCFTQKNFIIQPAEKNNLDYELKEIVKKEKIDLVIPTVDEELSFLSKNSQIYLELPILVSPAKTLMQILNKDRLFQLLKGREYVFETYDPLVIGTSYFINDKLFVKPVVGRGSKGCSKINNFLELKKYLKNNKYKINELIFTKYCEGKEWSVDAIVNKDGNSLLSISRTRIMRNGNPISGQCIKNEKLLEYAVDICQKIKFYGSINIQFIEHKGKYYLLEINPRFSGGDYIDYFSGANLAYLTLLMHYNFSFPSVKITSKNIELKDYDDLKFKHK